MTDTLRFGETALVRNARKDGRLVATLRLVRHGQGCSVEAHVLPRSGHEAEVWPGPYMFGTFGEASAFVDEAVDALGYLGCEIDDGLIGA